MPNHCCKTMNDFLEDKRFPILYFPKYREYNLTLINSNAIQGINFCPWCGKKLPKDLRDTYYDILESEYSNLDDQNIPVEFNNEEWWKKRGL